MALLTTEKLMKLGVQRELDVRDDKRRTILTCVPDSDGTGKYMLWRDEFTKRWRWALRNWPDDDLGGLANHGAESTIPEAVKRCEIHDHEREKLLRLKR